MNLILYFCQYQHRQMKMVQLTLISSTNALDDISKVHNGKDNDILIRSTVIFGTSWKLQTEYPQLNILFNPEFLTEGLFNFDFINQSRFIIVHGKQMSWAKSEEFAS